MVGRPGWQPQQHPLAAPTEPTANVRGGTAPCCAVPRSQCSHGDAGRWGVSNQVLWIHTAQLRSPSSGVPRPPRPGCRQSHCQCKTPPLPALVCEQRERAPGAADVSATTSRWKTVLSSGCPAVFAPGTVFGGQHRAQCCSDCLQQPDPAGSLQTQLRDVQAGSWG